MGSNDRKIDVDPDYEINNTALRNIVKNEEENSLDVEHLSNIIKEEFDKELINRQKQFEEIEEKITRAQKLLHIVRYVLVTSYYNSRGLEFTGSSNDETIKKVFDTQNRIHPAIKKLLGKNANLDVFSSLGKRKAVLKNCDNSEPSTSQASTSKRTRLDIKPLNTRPIENNHRLKNRKKTQHRLVIGNISKYMQSSEDGNTTHKWMVYVRGEKDKPDISHIVEKVKFYLHPSYKPHDVVEICESPFHLSRRGWGEFPLRVQIVFKSKLNKPIEIVHNLKLDKTCSGRQMLGNETLVDVYLHEIPSPVKIEPTGQSSQDCTSDSFRIDNNFLHEEVMLKEELQDEIDISQLGDACFNSSFSPLELSTELASQEHDYCHGDIIEGYVENIMDINLGDAPSFENVKVEQNHFDLFDHSYCASQWESEGGSRRRDEEEGLPSGSLDVSDNKLMYGLDESYLGKNEEIVEKKIPTMSLVKAWPTSSPIAIGQPIKILLPLHNNKTILTNGHLVPAPQNSIVLKTILPTRSRYAVKLPQNKFKNMGEVLPYIMKRVPLWTERARDADFKRSFPFMALSKEEFQSWNIGKRINAEWGRAKTIKKTLEVNFLPASKKWTTKAYFMYARSHMYSPMISFALFRTPSNELMLIKNCFKDSAYQKIVTRDIKNEVNIDVETDSDQLKLPRFDVIDISEPLLKPHCSFIKDAALDCGVVLKPEELVEGVIFNAAERMILEAVKCFAESLIRRGHHRMVTSREFRVGESEISSQDIQMALTERSEMQSIRDFRRRRQEMRFFS